MLDVLEVEPKQEVESDNSQGRVCRQTRADGGVWLLYYVTSDAAGTGPGQQLLAEAAAGGPITTAPCTVLGTAPTVLATVTVDPRGNPTTHRFNSNGYLIAQTDALGQTTQFERANGTNLLLSFTDTLGRTTRLQYDANGNVTQITDQAGNVQKFTYEPTFNKLTSITDPLGNVTQFAYDINGNLTTITDPLGNVTQNTYNQFGQPVSTSDALGNVTQFEYNAQGDLRAIIDPLGNATQQTHDLVSRLIAQSDPRGNTTRFSLDALNRLIQVVDPLNGVTTFTYDGNSNLLTVTDAGGSTTSHTYDSMDRLETRTDPLNRLESFVYDSNGNLTQFTDRKGQVGIFTHDPLNRRRRSEFADGSFIEFAYDAVGRLIRAVDSGTGDIVQEYDALNRLIRESTPQGTITYTYDALGRRTTMTIDGQPPVTYGYDANSRLMRIEQGPQAVTIDHDAIGRRTLLTLPNGVSTEYQYDASSRLTALIYRNAVGVLGDLTYKYDAVGNRIAVGGLFARTLLPDPVPSATYDAANQQLALGNNTVTYDANGNLVSITNLTGTTFFTWDAQNRLAGLSGPGLSASFAYDVFRRRVQQTVNGKLRGYQYDGGDIITEKVNGDTVIYLRSITLDQHLARSDSEFYLSDGLASVIAVMGADGVLVGEYTYAPFGRSRLTGATTNPFQFTGRENDDTGLYYYRARYYSPLLGRFLSEDPISIVEEDRNLYAYAGNNPVSFNDPLGLYSWNEFSRDVLNSWWAQVADIRASQNFWRQFREDALNRGDWVTATTADIFSGLLTVSGTVTVQESAEVLGSRKATLGEKVWAGVEIVGVGVSWYGLATTQVTGRIVGQARTSRLIGLRNKFGKHFFTDKDGFFFAIDRTFHRLHVGPWKTWFTK